MDDGVSGFSPDYATARERFRLAAEARGFRLEAHPIGATGPAGEELTIDVALLGAERPRRAVVVSSGLHGVEGFFGSAVQLALLQSDRDGWTPPDDSALVLVHALNPYGFAWIRRFDIHNVDLNRNFLREGERYEGCPPRYAQLDSLLNPKHAPSLFDAFLPWALLAIARHGMADLKQAIAGGQYEFPRGLFFGGHAPARVVRLLDENLPRWLGDATDIIHLDLHTGLGPWSGYKLLLEPEMNSEQVARIDRWFGSENVVSGRHRDFDYLSRGTLGLWCEARFPNCAYSYLCAEFGTYSSTSMLSALREENQAHQWGKPGARSTERAKARLREAFAPVDPRWRSETVARAVALVLRACAKLHGSSESPVAAGSQPD